MTKSKASATPCPSRQNNGPPPWCGTLAIIGALAVLTVLLIGAMALSWHANRQREIAGAWEVHTHTILDATAQLRHAALTTMRGESGFLLTGEPAFLELHEAGLRDIAPAFELLNRLAAHDPEQLERLALMEGRLDYHLGIMEMTIALREVGRREEMVERIRLGEGRRALDLVLLDLDHFERIEREALAKRTALRERTVLSVGRYHYMLGGAGVVLLVVSGVAAVALRGALTREALIRRELERSALVDELTGLANRRETLATLDRQIATARRHGRPLSIAILDIDHFKSVNDTYGHPAGDEVIRRVAQMAVEIMREQDLVGRFGGEEFVVILPDTDARQAVQAGERLRQTIASTTVLIPGGAGLNVTLSAGIAQMEAGDDRTTLIARADAALYRAKSQGRDRVLLAA